MASPHRRLILASASPRRRELLATLGLEFDVVPADVEEVFDPGLTSERIARDLALAKANRIAADHPDGVVLGADTLVVVGEGSREMILGKPDSADDARRMLRMLSGAAHRVVTGLAVVWSDSRAAPGNSMGLSTDAVETMAGRRERVAVVATHVRFRSLDDETIEAYIATGEPLDKAGAYGIQGGAAAFVEKVAGDYYNVVGLSLRAVAALLDGVIPVPGRVPGPPPMPFPIVP